MATTNEYVLKRLEAIESELAALKRLLEAETPDKEVTTFEGMWEGETVTEEDFEEAKRSLFKIEPQ
jgi:inosine/xanthosine triphosphate pyrophosphatase family protein